MAPPPPIRTRVWRNATLEREDFPFEQVSDYLAEPDTLVWADLVSPDSATVGSLAEELGLDPHAVEDALAESERPKATRYQSHLFLTAYSLRRDADGDLTVGRISIFFTRHALVTVRLDDAIDMTAVTRRWDENADLLKFGTRALLHGVLDQMVDDYFDALQVLDDEIESIEDVLFDEDAAAAKDVSRTVYELRRSLVQARRAILPMREVVGTVVRRTLADDGTAELQPYYEDLSDHVLRAVDWTDTLRDEITSVFDTNMQLSDNRMNQIMKKLTGWAAIIAVPTAVTGWYGQNVPYPGFDQPWGFWVSVIVIVVMAAVLYVSFKKRDWL
ncbi:magnesium transporter [Jatrophihabitans endophyticus]|uniref:Magnesium transporter n=1 Tax=Jatrophihabitans endophyticus TaxID=1206085 RepID=A0A1M5GEP8_9ACTN|nr:magnesium transporter CorA family protein [Jatrophihabitans endophyticus]SHG02184.1 magnesium transporter [Jatrophihabitans endophyticus]